MDEKKNLIKKEWNEKLYWALCEMNSTPNRNWRRLAVGDLQLNRKLMKTISLAIYDFSDTMK